MTSGIGVKRTATSCRRTARCTACPWEGRRLAPSKDYSGPLPHPCKECGGIVVVPPLDLRTPEERFWAKVDRSGGANACWPWTSTLDAYGYGTHAVGRSMRRAHRIAYRYLVGPIPDGLQLDHQCHNRAESCAGGPSCVHRRCVNPAHLAPATNVENTRRGRAGEHNRVTTHCQNGHELTPENVYVTKRGQRQCRTCRRAYSLAYYHRQRAAN